MKICAACRKPFDEVHPMDWMNDAVICRDLNDGRDEPGLCHKNHTWREHVAESWNGKWLNPHYAIEAEKMLESGE